MTGSEKQAEERLSVNNLAWNVRHRCHRSLAVAADVRRL